MTNAVGFVVPEDDGPFSGQTIVPGKIGVVVPIGSLVNLSDNTEVMGSGKSISYVVSEITVEIRIYNNGIVQLTWMHLEPYREI